MKLATKILKFALLSTAAACTLCLASCKKEVKTDTKEVGTDFNSINISADVSDITILPSEDEKCRIVNTAPEKVNCTAEILDKVLNVSISDSRNWFQKLFSSKMSLTVYLPENVYKTLTLKTSTGTVSLEKAFTFEDVNLTVDTGDIRVENIVCDYLTAKSDTGNVSVGGVRADGKIDITTDTGDVILGKCKSKEIFTKTSTGDVHLDSVFGVILAISVITGDIALNNVIADGKFDIVSNTGDVKFTGCDAASVFITTSTGNVVGSFLTDKIVFADTRTGKVDTPKLTNGGKCEITTSTGDIKITIE